MLSSSYQVLPQAVGDLCVRLNIPLPTDYEDSRNRVGVAVYVLTDFVWIRVAKSGLWLGGRVTLNGELNPAPIFDIPVVGPMSAPDSLGFSAPLYDMRGREIRVELEVQRAMRVGVGVTGRMP